MQYKLGNIAIFIRNGVNIKNDKSKGGIPITRIETISDGIVNENKMGYADIIDDRYKDYYLKQNDILMSHINSAKHLGKVAIFNGDKKIIHGMNLLDIRLNNNICNSKYVYYFFKTKKFKQELNRISKQSVNQSSFTVNDLKEIKISLPLLEKQKMIANKLDKVQAIITLRKKQIEELYELIKSQFVEMFEDKNYEKLSGKELFSFSSGKFLEVSKRLENGVPVYGGNGVAWYTDEPLIDFDTIVIGRVGAYCGNVKLIKEPVWITDNAIFIKHFKKDVYNIDFLYYMMELVDFSRFAQCSGQPKITQKPLEEFNYVVPPIEEQIKFSNIVKQIDKQKFILEKNLKETEELQESLMNKYFGG